MPEPDSEILTKECPLCYELMRLRKHELSERIPGLSQVVKHQVLQWECPDCSYEEEFDDEE